MIGGFCCGFGGFEVDSYFEKSAFEYDKILDEIEMFIIDNGITKMFKLMQLVSHMDCAADWRKVIRSRNTIYISALLASQRNYFKEQRVK